MSKWGDCAPWVQLGGILLTLALVLFGGGRAYGVLLTRLDGIQRHLEDVEYRLRVLEGQEGTVTDGKRSSAGP